MPPRALYPRVRTSFAYCTRDRGCSAHPAFPAPSEFGGRKIPSKPRAKQAARSRTHILSYGNCEERLVRRSSPSEGGSDEAIHAFLCGQMDCFAIARNDGL